MPIGSVSIYRFRLPLQRPLRLNACWLHERQGLLVVLTTSDGQVGLGECLPLPGFSTESLTDALSQLKALSKTLFNQSVSVERMAQTGASHCLDRTLYSSVSFALEGASLALCGKIPSADALTEYCPLLMGTRQQVMAQLANLSGSTEIKLKVGRSPIDEEIERVHDLCQKTEPSLLIRLDANRQWSFSEAKIFCRSVDSRRIAFIEEPLADYQRLPELGALTGFPLAVDESLQVSDYRFEPFIGLRAIVVKPMLTGGIVRARQWIKKAKDHGLRAIVSASYESPLGIQQLAWLAVTDTPGELPGLDTLSAFDDTAVCHFKECLEYGVKTGQFPMLENVWRSTAAH